MFAKLLIMILTMGAVATALLVNRQHRIDVTAEMSRTHWRLLEHERALWRMRADIPGYIRPENIRRAKQKLDGDWVSIPNRLQPTTPATARRSVERTSVRRQEIGG